MVVTKEQQKMGTFVTQLREPYLANVLPALVIPAPCLFNRRERVKLRRIFWVIRWFAASHLERVSVAQNE